MLSDVIVLDCETTVQRFDGIIDNSAKNPLNKLVAVGWWTQEHGYEKSVYFHNDQEVPDSRELLDKRLSSSKIAVFHNAKFDVLQLLERGFVLPEKVYCTMIGEYIFNRGQTQISKSLKATAERRKVTLKKSDLVDGLFKSGIGFEEIELQVVLEYLEADVLSCRDIYEDQQKDLLAVHNKCLRPVFNLMMDMMGFLVEIERNGIKINMDELLKVEKEFLDEKTSIEKRLKAIVGEVMGDTPINLHSGADLCAVVYSRRVKERDLHKDVWNICLLYTSPSPRDRG